MYFAISLFLASSILIFLGMHLKMIEVNDSRLGKIANYGTGPFLLKIIFHAKRERELTTKFAIARNCC
jgi:hypothetical protein